MAELASERFATNRYCSVLTSGLLNLPKITDLRRPN
jgi:hypothetical protein